MSNRNGKTLPPQLASDPTEASPTTAPSDMAPAVVLPQAAAAPGDDHRGQGGLYTVKDGKRVLVAATKSQAAKE